MTIISMIYLPQRYVRLKFFRELCCANPLTLPHCPNPCPHPRHCHDDVVKISRHWVVVESKVNENVRVDRKVDDDAKNVHLEPKVADTHRMADHGVVHCRHEPRGHAGKVGRAQQYFVPSCNSRTVLVAEKLHHHVEIDEEGHQVGPDVDSFCVELEHRLEAVGIRLLGRPVPTVHKGVVLQPFGQFVVAVVNLRFLHVCQSSFHFGTITASATES